MTTVLQRLDQEWAELTRSPQARRGPIRWACDFPALAGSADLADVLSSRLDPARSGPVLHALARLAPNDDLAARTLLQAMIPGLVRLSRVAGHDDPAAIDEMVSLAWERIRTYPPDRSGSVAANILLDVRKRYRAHCRIEAPTSHELCGEVPSVAVSPDDHVLGRLLLEALCAAQRDGLMSQSVLATILRTRLCGERLSDLAQEQQITTQVLCHRRWRAEVRLRDLPLAG